MTRPHVVIELERQYAVALSRYERAELATETIVGMKALAEADRRIQALKKVLTEKMDRIDYLIRIQHDPEWDRSKIQPLHIPKPGRRGEIAKAAYKVLKAAKEPMTVREIAHAVAPTLEVDKANYREINKLHSAIDGSLQRRLKEDEVEKIEGKPNRWAVRCKVWAPPSTRAAFASAPLVRSGVVACAASPGDAASIPPVRGRDAA